MIFSILICFILGLAVWKSFEWLYKYVDDFITINKIKGLPTLPFIGNALQLESGEELFYQQCEIARKFKDQPFYRLWIGTKALIMFHKCDQLDILFNGHKNNDKSNHYKFVEPWFGTGLLLSNGERWYKRRRLITPSFHFDILQDFFHIMNEQSLILADILAREAAKDKNGIVDMFSYIGLCALDIICETAMGKNLNAQNDHESEYVKTIASEVELVLERVVSPWQWPDFIYHQMSKGKLHLKNLDKLHTFTREVIKERNADFDPINFKNKKRIAFLDMLLKAKVDDESITFQDIQEEVDTFMFEGHDTTAASTAWACQFIGSHPEVQAKLHDEIDRVLGSSSRPLTCQDLNELKYLECVIKETMRICPSVPFFSRAITEDQEVAGYKLPKGHSITVIISMVHMDERYFPEPEKFDPDRFLPENSENRPNFAYIPFSAGKRNCIGQRFAMMEEKVILANLLRKFELKAMKTMQEVKPVANLILRPQKDLPIKLTQRI